MASIILFLYLYGILLISGGAMGYLKSGSVISLATGSLFGLLVILSTFFLRLGKRAGGYAALTLCGLMAAFFTYRVIKTPKLFPGGVMLFVSVIVFLVLIFTQKTWKMHRR